MARNTGETAEEGTVFYDQQGREFRARTPVEAANARFAWGYTEEKPKSVQQESDAPAGDPGPASGAVT